MIEDNWKKLVTAVIFIIRPEQGMKHSKPISIFPKNSNLTIVSLFFGFHKN